MPRPTATVRPATAEDVPALTAIWDELRAVTPRQPQRAAISAEERLRAVVADGACRVVVATVDDAPVGFAVLSKIWSSPLLDALAVQVTLLVVTGRCRRHGVGHALLGAAVGYADEIGADDVVASVLPTLREANRFYAQLGFSPMAVRRVTSVAALRRRLGGGAGERAVPRLGRRVLVPPRPRAALRRTREPA